MRSERERERERERMIGGEILEREGGREKERRKKEGVGPLSKELPRLALIEIPVSVPYLHLAAESLL